MNDMLKRPYEISIWEDVMVESEENSYYKELKIATIGSDTMTAPSRVFNPVLTINVNGETTLSFSIVHRYYDPVVDDIIINPLEQYLINERKVKLYYDDTWYDFVIKTCEEGSENNTFDYTATSLFVNELSKVGYNITLSNDLSNNQGTIFELAEKAVKNTDWVIDEENSDIIQQFVAEPLYRYKTDSTFSVLNLITNEEVTINSDEVLLIFYSVISNSQTENVQFLREIDNVNNKFTFDDNNVATGDNYRFKKNQTIEYNIETNQIEIIESDNTIATLSLDTSESEMGLNYSYQGYRLAYNQRTAYDPIMERPVSLYKGIYNDDDSSEIEIYKYTDYEYVTSDLIVSYVTNGSGFNVYANKGSLEGWSNTTYGESTGDYALQPIKLTTYPYITTKSVLDLAKISQIKGYLQTQFLKSGNAENGYQNALFNEGIENCKNNLIDHFSKGEKYVFRISYGTSTEVDGQPLNSSNTSHIKAIIAEYTNEEITKTVEDPTDSSRTITETSYVYKVDKDNILFDFSGPFKEKNNLITGGNIHEENGRYVAYYKDGVSVTPSVDTCYQDITDGVETKWIWDCVNAEFVNKENNTTGFLDYYYTTAECKKAISNTELTNNEKNIGIFLYADDELVSTEENPIYTFIKEVQIFKYREDADKNMVLIGNIPNSTTNEMDYYYVKPKEGQVKEDIEVYSTQEALINSLYLSEIKSVYNEKYEKVSSIEASQSNCFNIIQDLCEAFECWAKFHIKHDKNGAITLNADGAPSKSITFHIYSGKENFAGFKYGINLQSIQRTIDSNEFVSKLIVEQVENENVTGGIVSIANAPSNPTGNSYILNMSYYLNQGLIEDPDTYNKDYEKYIKEVKELNDQYNTIKSEWTLASTARTKAVANVNVYKELVEEAEKKYTEAVQEFEDLTGTSYGQYASGVGLVIDCQIRYAGTSGDVSWPDSIVFTYSKGLNDIEPVFYDSAGARIHCKLQDNNSTIDNGNKIEDTYIIDSTLSPNKTINNIAYLAILDKITIYEINNAKNYSDESFSRIASTADLKTQKGNYIWSFSKEKRVNDVAYPTDENETLVSIIGEIYSYQQIIYNYKPLLDLARIEKNNLDLLIDGTDNFTLSVVTNSQTDPQVSQEELSIYKPGLVYTLLSEEGSYDIVTNETEKTFIQNELYNKIYFKQYPDNYQLKYTLNNKTYYTDQPAIFSLSTDASKFFTFVPIEEVEGLKDKMEDLLDAKDEVEIQFYSKYSRYIQEGTWTSQDYVDSELYYLDALKISNTSAQPKVTYNLSVQEISELDGLENYKFQVGDKTYIEDTAFFGYRESVLDETSLFVVTDQKTIILPETLTDIHWVHKNHEQSYANVDYIYDYHSNEIEILTDDVEPGDQLSVNFAHKLKTPIQEEVVVSEVVWNLDNPAENSITIQNYKTQFEDLFQRVAAAVQSVEYNSAKYMRAASILNDSGTIDAGLLLKSLNDLSGGYSLSGDGTIQAAEDGIIIIDPLDSQLQMKLAGNGLKTSVDGGYTWNTALNANGLTINTIDTQEVIIKDGDNPSFRWDKAGLNAYGFDEYDQDGYDLKTYVRFDKYGLYGVQNGETFQAESLDDVKNTAHFGITWDGFFIKNSYTDGYVSISSDNDIQVVSNDVERIKIGAIDQDINGNYRYGININNALGENVFTTSDDGNITITGDINATGGNFTNEITVGSGSSTIQLIGTAEDAVIGSSDYFNDTSKGWAIKAAGDAIFNNVTVRGAIKTAVFEYEEIEAVGGIFLFRPSSTIRTAELEWINTSEDEEDEYGDDLYVTVENPLLFKIGDWCKVSNYTGATTQPNLAGSGLTNIYEITKIENNVLTLDGGAHMFDDVLTNPTVTTQKFSDITESNHIFTLTPESLTTNYNYDIIIPVRIVSTDEFGNDTYEVLSDFTEANAVEYSLFDFRTPQSVIFTDDSETEIVYIGNLALKYTDLIDTEYNTGEDYLFISYNLNSYLYVSNDNILYKEDTVIQTSFRVESIPNASYGTDSLVGGALISFGNYPYSIDAGAAQLTENYGIGINSSDSAVNLPARAISLFETEIYPNNSIRVGYNFRGILGTLPSLGSDKASTIYENNMVGTQGIYTDNMYIGDNSQYIAFYEDENGNKQLKIRANQVVYEVVDDQGETQWHDVSEIETEGTPGPAGQDAISVIIDSSAGNVFINGVISTILRCYVYKGGVDITNNNNYIKTYTWTKINISDGSIIQDWTPTVVPLEPNAISVNTNDVTHKAVFQCSVDVEEV